MLGGVPHSPLRSSLQRAPRSTAIPRASISPKRAFTLIDLLVSIAIIAILLGIMLPSLTKARHAAQQVVCSSNARQHGLGLMMYADDYTNHLPPTKFNQASELVGPRVDKMVIIRDTASPTDWDGLGILYAHQYLDAQKIFFCPAHRGDHPYARYAPIWNNGIGQIVSNYQYRGPEFDRIEEPTDVALVTDALRTKRDFNHRVGTNVLRADFSVLWLQDRGGRLAQSLPELETDALAAAKIEAAWLSIDEQTKATAK